MDKNTSSAKSDNKKTESKVLAICALVFGILGIVSCWTGFFSLVCCLVGVILGIVALVKKQQKGMAIAGLVCGALGLIPAILFSFLWGGLATIFGGVANELDAYNKDPVGYCAAHSSYHLCKKSDSNNGNNNSTNTSGNSKIVDEIYDYLKDEDDSMDMIPEDDMKGLINDLVVCLDKAGVNVDSFEAIEDEDDDNEDAAECREQFAEDLFKAAMDSIDIDLDD